MTTILDWLYKHSYRNVNLINLILMLQMILCSSQYNVWHLQKKPTTQNQIRNKNKITRSTEYKEF